MKKWLILPCFISLSLACYSSFASDDEGPLTESDLNSYKVPEAESNDFPGESFGIQRQRPMFDYQDLSIPGPNDMDITITRSYGRIQTPLIMDFGISWSLNIPFISIYRPSGSVTQHDYYGCFGYLDKLRYVENGKPTRTVGYEASNLPSGTILSFNDNSILKCENNLPVIYKKNGIKLNFFELTSPSPSTGPKSTYALKSIQDRFGNSITYNYSYNNSFSQYQIESIKRSDNVVVNFQYENIDTQRYISIITYGDRKLQYSYDRIANRSFRLNNFKDAEGLQTKYSYAFDSLKEVEIPTGAKITYRRTTINPDLGLFGQVMDKTISGPGMEKKTISYVVRAGFIENDRHVQVTQTDHNFQPGLHRKTFYSFRANKLDFSEYENGVSAINGTLTTIVQKVGSIPQTSEGDVIFRLENYWDYVVNGRAGCKKEGERYYPKFRRECGRAQLKKRRVVLYNEGGVDEYITEYLTYDAFGTPVRTKEYMQGSTDVRYKKFNYSNDTANWQVGFLLADYYSGDNSIWNENDRFIYHSLSGQYKGAISKQYKYGKLLKQYTYHPNGDVKRVTQADNVNYTQYDNYYLGQSRTITIPHPETSGASISSYRKIDVYGNVKESSDYEGNMIKYNYNKNNQLIYVDYNNAAFDNRNIEYKYIDSSDTGLTGIAFASNQMKVVETLGAYQKIEYLNGVGQPQIIMERDINESNSKRFLSFSYNKDSLISFSSIASDLANETSGLAYNYDGLMRRIEIIDTATQDNATRTFLKGNSIRFSNFRDKVTTKTYRAFGTPSYSMPMLIKAPENVQTSMLYNIFDNVLKITQSGISHSFYYNDHQELCKSYAPETNWSYKAYNATGDVVWYSEGQAGNHNGACEYNLVPENQKINLRYNLNNRLKKVDFPDSTPEKSYFYDLDGRVEKMDNGVVRSFKYNPLGYLTQEETKILGKVFNLKYGYSTEHQRNSITYPSGNKVDWSVNGLGQISKIPRYINNAKYHSSGSIEELVYANGIKQTFGFNDQNLLDATDIFNRTNSRVAGLTYNYDENRNIDSITDRVSENHSINMTYDGLDRLKTANGIWGIGSFTYDGTGNIKTQKVGSRSLTYTYDSMNLLRKITGSLNYSFTYDNKGNITQNGRTGFAYNAENQLRSASTRVVYSYDAQGRRASKDKNHNFLDYFVYDAEGKLVHKANPEEAVDYIYIKGKLIAKDSSKESGLPMCKSTGLVGTGQHGKCMCENNVLGTNSCMYCFNGECYD
ncbi:tRNA3(Ser)-specific nuclease WapA [Thalassocella blandensis]|nr:tRNA3(Ser)-specific nuclease WapA [Thalassocella blandensis]